MSPAPVASNDHFNASLPTFDALTSSSAEYRPLRTSKLCMGQSAVSRAATPVWGNDDCSAGPPASVCVASHIANAATLDLVVNVANRVDEVRMEAPQKENVVFNQPPSSSGRHRASAAPSGC